MSEADTKLDVQMLQPGEKSSDSLTSPKMMKSSLMLSRARLQWF